MCAFHGLPFLQEYPSAALVPEEPLLPPTLTLVFCLLFLTHFHHPHPLCLSSIFFPFLSMFSQRYHRLLWQTYLCPVVCPLGSLLELAVSGMGHAPASSHRGHTCSPSAAKTLPNTSNTMVHMWVHQIICFCSFLFPRKL